MTLFASSVMLAADPLLPQRDLLLDEDEVARRLSHSLGVDGPLTIDACERIRTKYRFGDSLRVVHRIRAGSFVYTIAARAFRQGRSERAYKRALGESSDCAPLRPVIHDAELETVFWTYPNDRRLSGLQALTNVQADLAQVSVPSWTRSCVVAYAPEKCVTARCLDDRARLLAYAKLYAGSEGERITGVYQALERSLPSSPTSFGLPRPISYVEAYRALILEPVEGERIADLSGSEMRRGYEHLGSALAGLHSLPVPEGLPPFKRLDVERVLRAAQIISQARPDVRREAGGLAAKLADRWRPPAGPFVCLHGDVHPKNGILSRDGLTLIDLDQAGTGHPAADLGSLLASLSYNHLGGLVSGKVAQDLSESFLAGYERVRELPGQACLDWHTAAALLAERALRAVNRIRPAGLDCLPELLLEARQILQAGGTR